MDLGWITNIQDRFFYSFYDKDSNVPILSRNCSVGSSEKTVVQRNRKTETSFFNTFEVDMALLITSKPASFSCFTGCWNILYFSKNH